MLRRTLPESGISAPVEGVGIRVFCSIQKGPVQINVQSKRDLLESNFKGKRGLSESNFGDKGTKGPVRIMPSIGRGGGGVRIKNGMSH